LKQSPEQVEGAPAIRRAILLRDLWPVFDDQTKAELPQSKVAASRQARLRVDLAKVMRRLELSAKESEQLPDNFQAAIAGANFPTTFDERAPERGFLPPDLFDEAGPWVPIGNLQREKMTPGARGHLRESRVRSVFVPYVRVSSDREKTIELLAENRKLPQIMPPGTLLALVRRTVLPTSAGRIVLTPIVESLQFIVVDGRLDSNLRIAAYDHRYKFVLDRARLIAGQPGLRMLTDRDPVDPFGFEVTMPIGPRPRHLDADGELPTEYLVGLHYASLSHCAVCHGPTVEARILFGKYASTESAAPATWDEQVKQILSRYEKSPAWQAYRDLHD
jgi:hypothetical protein